MKVFYAIVILSVLCITSKAQHFCESLIQNNYETMFYWFDRGGIFVIGDKYYGLRQNGDLILEPDQPLPPNGSIVLFNDYSIHFYRWRYTVPTLDFFYNPTKKSIDYIQYNINTGVFEIERKDVQVKGGLDLLENATFAFNRKHRDHILVSQKPSSVDDSLVSTYFSVDVIQTDSNTTLSVNFKSDESKTYNEMFENYSSNGYRLMGMADFWMIHQRKGSFVYCFNLCINGSEYGKELIDCDSLGFTGMTTITTETETLSNGGVPDLNTASNGNTPDGHTPVANSPQVSFGTQSNGGGDVTRNPDPNIDSSPKSTSFWMILLILLIIAGVVAVVIVSIVWFIRHSQQKSEKGVESEAHKSAPKSSADGKNQSEVVSVRSQ